MYKMLDLFKMISAGDFFNEGDPEININFGEEAQELRALVATFNEKNSDDWFCKICLEETNLAKWWFKFTPLNRETFLFYRNKKIEKLTVLYGGNRTYACRAAHNLYSFEPEVVEAVMDLRILSKCSRSPAINVDDPLTTNTNLCKWCEGVSPKFLELSVPRKITVVQILYGRYIDSDPLEIPTSWKLGSVIEGGDNDEHKN